MRTRVLLVVAVAILAVVGVHPVLAITGGQPDTEHPNVGAIMAYWPGEEGWVPLCSGTLVHERVFLTAGHCTWHFDFLGKEPEDLRVSFAQEPYVGDPPSEPDPSWLGVGQMIWHEGFVERAMVIPHDVGALILAEPVEGIEPANLPPEGFLDQLREEGKLRPGPDGAKFTVVGYGATLYWPPPHKAWEDKRQFAESEYRALLKSWLRLSGNQAIGEGGGCFGDSGGPAFWTEPDGTEILVGIASTADAVCVAPEVRYRVDIADTLIFIDEVIDSLN
jgi:hypothetical protein